MRIASELTDIESLTDEDTSTYSSESLSVAESQAHAATTEYNAYIATIQTSRQTRQISGNDKITSIGPTI